MDLDAIADKHRREAFLEAYDWLKGVNGGLADEFYAEFIDPGEDD